jgi:hypothetical protein
MKGRDIVIYVRENVRAVRCKDRCDVYILTNMHAPPVEANFTVESGHVIKPCSLEDCSAYMGFVDKSEQNGEQLPREFASGLRNCFSISQT